MNTKWLCETTYNDEYLDLMEGKKDESGKISTIEHLIFKVLLNVLKIDELGGSSLWYMKNAWKYSFEKKV